MPGNTVSSTRGERGGTTTSTTPTSRLTRSSGLVSGIDFIETARRWLTARLLTSPAVPDTTRTSSGSTTWRTTPGSSRRDWSPIKVTPW